MTEQRKAEILQQAKSNIYKCTNEEYVEIIKDFYGDNPPNGWNRNCTYCRLQKLRYIEQRQNILN